MTHMNELNIKSFDEFVKTVNESANETEKITEKEVWRLSGKRTDAAGGEDEYSKLTIKDEGKKIRIVVSKPVAPDEKLRYDFKVITSSPDDKVAEQEALNHIANLIADQVEQKKVTADMVGFINTEKAQRRAVGDYVLAGVLSFYPASKFTNLDKVAPIKTFPVPTTEEKKEDDLPVTSKVVEDAKTPAASGVRIYNYSQMKDLLPPESQAGMNIASAAKVSGEKVEEPGTDKKQATTASTTQTTTVAPVKQEPESSSYENLAKSMTVNPLVKELQAKILVMGKTDPNFSNLHDAGRLDIVHECIVSSLFLSHGLRRDVTFHTILNGPPNPPQHIQINGESLYDVRTDMDTWQQILKKTLAGKTHPGISKDKTPFEVLLKTKAQTHKIYVLEEDGKDLADVEFGENSLFVLGDHVGLPKRAEDFALRFGEKISLGKTPYLATNCITIINYTLDQRQTKGGS